LNDVFRGFCGGLRIRGHVVQNVILHKLSHQAVDTSACGGQALKNLCARIVFTETPKDRLQLANDFLGAIREV
jgi:hypothetical protein